MIRGISFYLALLFSFVLGTPTASAEIQEVATMQEALTEVDSDTLLIFDLDNTVMMPAQTLGGEEWYDYLVSKYSKDFATKGTSEEAAKPKAIERAIKEWNSVIMVTGMVPVEDKTPGFISQHQERGAKTMGLTARPLELMEKTHTQLKDIQIDFQKNGAVRNNRIILGKHPSQFYKGILFVGPKNNKGEVLIKFLKMTGLQPKKIVFVDNKRHHVENVEKALAPMKISYLGCRYGAADKKIASFNREIADIQHKFFGGILRACRGIRFVIARRPKADVAIS